MFTGLVSDVGEVMDVTALNNVTRLRIACAYAPESIALGASIACAGTCLTAIGAGTSAGRNWFDVEAGAETLRLTTLKDWRAGTRINLERSLKVGDEMGGHMVSGHVDGIAQLVTRRDFDGLAQFDFDAPAELARFIAKKGSVCLDGTSLTVNEVAGRRFSVLLIPHTLAVTTWGQRRAGDPVNLEIDLMARYAARLGEIQG
ncbi:MAG: riboflavin synthase [Hyphomicrobiales bacterium]|nr:riboflavin synthase [Hyphomicrobiales bacterium]